MVDGENGQGGMFVLQAVVGLTNEELDHAITQPRNLEVTTVRLVDLQRIKRSDAIIAPVLVRCILVQYFSYDTPSLMTG